MLAEQVRASLQIIESVSFMRYLESAVSLMLAAINLAFFLPKAAVATSEEISTDIGLQVNNLTQRTLSSTSFPLSDLSMFSNLISATSVVSGPQSNYSTQLSTVGIRSVTLSTTRSESIQLRDRLFGESTQLPAKTVSRRSKADEPVILSQSSDGTLPTLTPSDTDSSPATDTLPVIPEVTPSDAPVTPSDNLSEALDAETTTPSEILESETAPPASAPELEIEAIPDSLFADPNPLAFPTTTEEVTIEQSPTITIEHAIELAYRNNQSLQAAILSQEQAAAAVREARAALRPNVDVGSNLTTQESTRPTNIPGLGAVGEPSGADTTLAGSVEVNYNLLTGGSRRASIRVAELQEQISTLAVEVQQEQIRLSTANAYYDLQDAGEQIRINQSFLEEAARNLRDSRLRQEVGVGTRFDTLRAEVQFANARQSLIQSQSQERVNRRAISQLLNLPSTSSVTTTPVTVADNWPLDLEESIILAFQNRAELEQQLYQSDLNEEQRKIALAAIRPTLQVFTNYSAQTFINDSDGILDNYSFGVRFNWRPFDGGAARARARQQELASQIAEEQFGSNLDQVRFDVEQSFFNLRANQENIATSEIAVAQAEEALALANLRLQAGVGTQLDVLNAQSELTQSQGNNVAAILGYNRALVAIERAISNINVLF